ncbi:MULTISPECIES: tail tape measure protein [unclassified Sphingobium]|uniref:tail tape measure protein n=1 Tax=unclassified Sphingobium TaxID=2611147 RepID=UPI0022254FEF|nr:MULTISPECIES: tail tape measure protein [unclassified Sphingobium]MCW2382540.1 phage-related minor tail protein [Sphingobium sp. B2D3B]MCW2397287.1 phage-related minor tail protein [Sphingobium sp. B2D3C]
MDEDMQSLFAPMGSDMARLREDASGLRDELDLLSTGAERASRAIEAGLLRAVRTGRIGFEDLGKIALSVMDQIARSAVRNGLEAILGGGGSSGLLGLGTSLLTGALGLPGRATGGPVAPGRAYLVGERGPEVFVPTNSGQIVPGVGGQGGRDVRVSITVNGSGQDAPRALARSARQVARAVRGALGD